MSLFLNLSTFTSLSIVASLSFFSIVQTWHLTFYLSLYLPFLAVYIFLPVFILQYHPQIVKPLTLFKESFLLNQRSKDFYYCLRNVIQLKLIILGIVFYQMSQYSTPTECTPSILSGQIVVIFLLLFHFINLAENDSVRMGIIRYYLLLKSTALKLYN